MELFKWLKPALKAMSWIMYHPMISIFKLIYQVNIKNSCGANVIDKMPAVVKKSYKLAKKL